MNSHIAVLYKTPAGSVWETREQALVAHRLEAADLYIDGWTLKQVVKTICTPAEEENKGTME